MYKLAAFLQVHIEADAKTQDNLKSIDLRKKGGCFHVLVNEHNFALGGEAIFLLGKIQLLLNSMSICNFCASFTHATCLLKSNK